MKKFIKASFMFTLMITTVFALAACSDEEENGLPDDSDAEEITLWFYNSEDWDSVYAKSDDHLDLTDDMAATEYEERDDWYFITINRNVLRNPLDVVFHNGSGEEADTATFDHPSFVFSDIEGEIYGTRSAVVQQFAEFVEVYFYNSEAWDNVGVWSWRDGVNVYDDWPGEAAEDQGDGWWMMEIPLLPEDGAINIIFNNFVGEDTEQTDDLVITHRDSVYLTHNGFVLNDQSIAETFATFEEDEFTRFHFYNEDGWENIHAYMFGDNEAFGGWPGQRVSEDEDQEDWYYVYAPVDPDEEDVNIIFNSDDNQTGDIAVPSSDHVYIASSQTKDGEAYTSFEDASGLAPTYTTTIDFWNVDDWDTVYVDASDEDGVIAENEAMEADEDGWLTLDLVTEIEDTEFTVTFHNNDDIQSEAFTFSREEDIVFLPDETFQNRNMVSIWEDYDTDDYVRYYFLNSEGWEDLNGYIWSDADEYPYQDMLGAWPGTALSEEADSDWYYIDIPVTFTEDGYANFIVNATNPEDDEGVQTGNILLNNDTDVYMTVLDEAFETKASAKTAVDEQVEENGEDQTISFDAFDTEMGQYESDETILTVDDIEFGYKSFGIYDDDHLMQGQGDNGQIYNLNELDIEELVITFDPDHEHDPTFTVYGGYSAADNDTEIIETSDDDRVYAYDFSDIEFTHFLIQNNQYALYIIEIEIRLAD